MNARNFDHVRAWFKKAGDRAAAVGKADSALLWADGLAHLTAMHDQRSAMRAALEQAEQALSTLPPGAASLKTANALQAVRDAIVEALAAPTEPKGTP